MFCLVLNQKDGKKLPITDNVLIEELLGGDQFGAYGCICIEDIIDTVFKCHDDNLSSVFSEIQKVMWPFQVGSLKETIEEANMKHEATGRDVRKKNSKTSKGGYIGNMGDQINEFIRPLI